MRPLWHINEVLQRRIRQWSLAKENEAYGMDIRYIDIAIILGRKVYS